MKMTETKPDWQVQAELHGWTPPCQTHGDAISTRSGKLFFPLHPRPEAVSLFDIAHALSKMCRWNGQGRIFYSVAQHSLAVEAYLARLSQPVEVRLLGLLHDASEAYMADLPSPVKALFPQYKLVEKGVQAAIYESVGLVVTPEMERRVKDVDTLMLVQEAMVLGMNIAYDGQPVRIPDIAIEERPMDAVKAAFRIRVEKLLTMLEQERVAHV